jgi:hypothetical protein
MLLPSKSAVTILKQSITRNSLVAPLKTTPKVPPLKTTSMSNYSGALSSTPRENNFPARKKVFVARNKSYTARVSYEKQVVEMRDSLASNQRTEESLDRVQPQDTENGFQVAPKKIRRGVKERKK